LISVTIPFYLVSCIIKMNDFSLISLLGKFLAISKSGYFVECYLLLMFFSPVFNAFIEKQGKNIIAWVFLFWAIEVYFDFLIHDVDLGFQNGYSFIHFALIYMIGRSLNIYKERLFHIKNSRYISIYLFSTFAILAIYIFLDMKSVFDYSSPLNLIATCSLFMIFAKRTFYSRSINWIASSTFAVYIIHIHPPVINWLKSFDMQTLANQPYPYYLLIMAGIIVLVFMGSILYDKVAKLITEPMVSWTDHLLQKYSKRLHITFDA